MVRFRIPEVARLASGATLHVGCAGDPRVGDGGALHEALLKSAPRVVGLDLVPAALRVLDERADRGDGLVAGDALALPFADRGFDTVVAAEVVEHVGWPERLLVEARRVLRPDGRLIVSTPNPFCIQWLPMARRGQHAPWDPGHVGWFDPTTLAALARRAGLRARGVTWVRNARPTGKVPRRLAAYMALRPILSRVLPAYLVAECFVQVFEVAPSPADTAFHGDAA